MAYKRIFGIVLDSVGIGAAPDAVDFGDLGSDTLGHIGEFFNGEFKLPNLQKLGLGNIRQQQPIQGVEPINDPLGYYGKMAEISAGKDSMDGHWEMMGLPVTQPLHYYPEGFPKALIDQIESFSGRKVIVNLPYSGTEVIAKYGEQQLKTGDLIVYTSGDSVLQIAANTAVIPLAELYKICEFAREITINEPYRLGRVIARPYTGTTADNFTRTSDRHDYTLEPTADTDLDRLKKAGIDVIAIGKINDIFSGHGITKGYHTISNMDGMDHVLAAVNEDFTGFCFTNLVDFDAMYGHRRNPAGYGKALMEFDARLGEVMAAMKPDDLLMITADHGNDPGYEGTDHTREFVPIVVYSPSFTSTGSLGIRKPFSDFGATVLANFKVQQGTFGQSFLSELK